MADLDDIRVSFFEECEDLLESLGHGLMQMQSATHEIETVHAVFRAVHSIKGGAAAFSLDDLTKFAHRFETVLDEIRSDRLNPEPAVMGILLRSGDCLADLVAAAKNDAAAPSQMIALLADFDELLGEHDRDAEEFTEYQPILLTLDDLAAPSTTLWQIDFRPTAELFRSANDPLRLFQALETLGEMSVSLSEDTIPLLADLDPDASYLGWHIELQSDCSQDDIEAIFDFVLDVAEIKISAPASGSDHFIDIAPISDPAAQPMCGPTADDAPTFIPETGAKEAPAAPVRTPQPATAGADSATIRVNLTRVDRLINLIGELVIKEAMLTQAVEKFGALADNDISIGLDGIKTLASEIQESMMSIRAQPLKPVFQRMQRILREAADATGKAVQLITLGEQTEVDRTVVEKLVDPLTHMIRNSVDHGLESGDIRLQAGKSETGTITLSAAHRSGRVVIEVSDDGGGINRKRVRQIAENKGPIQPGANLSPADIDALLFLPGFSSKSEVSALSGRGVGLDVVKREIQALGGRVTISSNEGEGTTFSIALPLTLAVLEGMLVRVGDQTMVIPLSAIQESLRPRDAQFHAIGMNGRVVANRGELIPVLDIADMFGMLQSRDISTEGTLVIIETDARQRAALLVDQIYDQRQVVIKSLEENYGRIPAISSATILGDGRIALIIDPEEIITLINQEGGAAGHVLAAAE